MSDERADRFLRALRGGLDRGDGEVLQGDRKGAAMAENDAFPPLKIVNRAIDAPSVHVDSLQLGTLLSGTVRFNFLEAIADPIEAAEPGWKNRYVLSLAMSEQTFLDALKYMNGLAETWRRDGRLSVNG